jgi:hypothetical protein
MSGGRRTRQPVGRNRRWRPRRLGRLVQPVGLGVFEVERRKRETKENEERRRDGLSEHQCIRKSVFLPAHFQAFSRCWILTLRGNSMA